jgi:hypothetical protein
VDLMRVCGGSLGRMILLVFAFSVRARPLIHTSDGILCFTDWAQ